MNKTAVNIHAQDFVWTHSQLLLRPAPVLEVRKLRLGEVKRLAESLQIRVEIHRIWLLLDIPVFWETFLRAATFPWLWSHLPYTT